MCDLCFVWDRLNDSGILSHKEHLPLRLLAVGDVNRPGSEAAYRVGPLQCYGDSKYQNFPNKVNPKIVSEPAAYLCRIKSEVQDD